MPGFTNLDYLGRAAARESSGLALITPQGSFTYRELLDRSNESAATLKSLGVRHGHTVLIHTRFAEQMIVATHAIWSLGATSAPLDRTRSIEEIQEAAKEQYVAAAFVDDVEVLANEGLALITTDGRYQQARHIPEPMRNDSPALLLHTSGTTGASKAVEFSERALVSNIEALISTMTWSSEDKCLTPALPELPAVLTTCVLPAIAVGASVQLVDPCAPRKLVQHANMYRPTILYALPYTYELLCRSRSVSELPTDIRLCVSSSAPTRPATLETFWRESGHLIRSMYCSSEAGACTFNDSTNLITNTLSVGRAIQGVAIQIIESPLSSLPVGEIVVGGNLTGDAYRCDPPSSEKTFQTDGVHTGDLGWIDEQGYLYLAGRSSDVINYAGSKVIPARIEEVLLEHSSVEEAFVFGEHDDLVNERVVARVVLNRSLVTVHDLVAHCKQRLAERQMPQRIEIVAALERSGSGKVRKPGSPR
jgi:long-chain acyl-CoA synthetase